VSPLIDAYRQIDDFESYQDFTDRTHPQLTGSAFFST